MSRCGDGTAGGQTQAHEAAGAQELPTGGVAGMVFDSFMSLLPIVALELTYSRAEDY